jgi:hypothetical protein
MKQTTCPIRFEAKALSPQLASCGRKGKERPAADPTTVAVQRHRCPSQCQRYAMRHAFIDGYRSVRPITRVDLITALCSISIPRVLRAAR